MLIFAYWCGQLDISFTDKDILQVDRMCRVLDNPANDLRSYELEDGSPVLFWRKDGKIHGNIFGHDERDILESEIANANC